MRRRRVSGDISITPSKAGTKKKPKPAKFTFKVTNSPESKTTVKQIVLGLPKGVKFDGTKLDEVHRRRRHQQGPRVPERRQARQGRRLRVPGRAGDAP